MRHALKMMSLVSIGCGIGCSGPTEPSEQTSRPPLQAAALSTPKGSDRAVAGSTVEDPWRLIWHDEFDSPALDRSTWNVDLGQGQGGWGNGELQVYTDSPENLSVKDGKLLMRVTRNGSGYASSRLQTKDRFLFKYGKVQIRAKMPRGQAVWPALWMMGANHDVEQWPFCGEVDIAEMKGGPSAAYKDGLGGDNSVFGALHWYDSRIWGHAEHGVSTAVPGTLSDDFHVYEVEWYPDRLLWKLDGQTYGQSQYGGNLELNEFYSWPYFLVFNLAVGGPSSSFTEHLPVDNSVFPQQLEIDWVRVYQTPDMTPPAFEATYKPSGQTYNLTSEGLTAQGLPGMPQEAKIDLWNPAGSSIQKTSDAYEGQEAILVRADGTQPWFGIGYNAGKPVDLGWYRTLTLAMKTTSKATLKLGVTGGNTAAFIYFINGADPYGFKRDGQWHLLHLPLGDFGNYFNWSTTFDFFSLVGGGIKEPVEIYLDGLYYDGKSDNPDDYFLYPRGHICSVTRERTDDDDSLIGPKLTLDWWNQQGFSMPTCEAPFEGEECARLSADGTGGWFGVGFRSKMQVKLSDYKNLKLALRTPSTGRFKIGMLDTWSNEGSVEFGAGKDGYGLIRDGRWHVLTIPLSALSKANQSSLQSVFTLSGDQGAYQIDIDDVYFEK